MNGGTMTVKEGLQAALAAFGPNGEGWGKGPEVGSCFSPEGTKVCALTAAGAVSRGGKSVQTPESNDLFVKMKKLLHAHLPSGHTQVIDFNDDTQVIDFNDAPETTFEDIRALYNRAIEAADGI
jgi:hypothetical protein